MEKLFTRSRFVLLLALSLGFIFSKVLIGTETFAYRDFGVLAYPSLWYHHESFWRGELPLWNPLSNCGAPFLAQWGAMVLYPFSLFYLILPMPWSVNVFCLAHLLLAGAGLFRLVEKWTSHPFAAAFAGFAFVFNGVTFSCLIWPNYLVALGWMPWVVFWTEKAWETGGRAVGWAAVASALQMLAGVPEIATLTWLINAGLACAALRRPESTARQLFTRTAMIAGIVSALIAVQLLPFLELLNHSQRTGGFTSSRWALPSWGWGNFFVPLLHSYQNFQGIFFQTGQEFFSSVYLGLTSLVLATSAVLRIRQRRVWALAAVTLFSILMAFGENGGLYPLLRDHIPGLGIARYPVKFLVIPAFTLPVLAAYTIAALQVTLTAAPDSDAQGDNPGADERRSRRMILTWMSAIAGAAGVVIAIILWLAYRHPLPLDQWSATWRSGVERAILLAALLGGLVLTTRLSVERRWLARLSVLGLLVVDLLTHTPRQNPTVPSAALAPGLWEASHNIAPPALGQGRVMITPESEQALLMSRVPDVYKDLLGKRLALWSNLNLLDRVPKVSGSSTLQIREQHQVQNLLYQSTNAAFPRILDFLSVTWVTAPGRVVEWTRREGALPLITAGQQPVYADPTNTLQGIADAAFDPKTMVVLPEEARTALIVTNSAKAEVTSTKFSAHRIEAEISTAAPAIVVIAQSFYGPWRARVDGRPAPLWRANHAFQGVEIPAGDHHVELVYHDQRFALGAVISGLAWAACLWGLVRKRYKV